MSGCSLTDAFPDTTDKSGLIAKREERKRAKKCPGPALTFLKSADEQSNIQMQDYDPDRHAKRPDPVPAKMNGRGVEGFSSAVDFKPVMLTSDERYEKQVVKDLAGQRVDDVIGEKARSTLPRATKDTDYTSTSYGLKVPSYFGKDLSDGFADFSASLSDNPGYQVGLQSGGAAGFDSFERTGADKANGSILPKPSINNVWKPLSPGGVQSSFFESLPTHTGRKDNDSFSREEKEALLKKLDILFAKIDDLEHKRNDYAHTEVTMFILSGLFLLFGLETIRKFK